MFLNTLDASSYSSGLMASVFRRPQSKYWHAGWRDSSGKFHLRSTKLTERSKALSVALEWERVEKMAHRGEMVEAQVRLVINDILKKVGESIVKVPSIQEWLLDWHQEKVASKSKGTAERYKYVIDDFLACLGERGQKPLTALSARDIQGYIAKRMAQKIAPSTVNIEGRVLRACFNRAKRQGLIPTNPAEAIELPANRGVERGTFTPAEIKILLESAKKVEWKTMILFGYYTGAR